MNKCTRCGKENPAEIHTCTPLALRLAEMLEGKRLIAVNVVEIAAELRRLYEENERLKTEPKKALILRLQKEKVVARYTEDGVEISRAEMAKEDIKNHWGD